MLTYPQIDPVALAIGPLKIHWYGLMYLIGIGGAWLLASRRMKRFDPTWTKERLSDLVFWVACGVILGGRLGYVLFYNLDEYIANPTLIFEVWKGGMSFHGTASVSGLFVLCYGIFRFVVEFVRVPDAQLGYLAWGWLTMGQVLCVPMVLAGIALMVWAYRRDAAQPKAA